MRVGWANWALDVPDEWTITDHPECLTLELSNDSALQISSMRKKAGVVDASDLLTSKQDEWGASAAVTCGEFDGVSYEYLDGGSLWRRWYLKWGQTMLIVTYNGAPAVAERERGTVDNLLSTVQTRADHEA